MILRSLRLAKAVATVMYDFHSVKKLDADSYKLEMPNFHQRTADLLYNMCCENRGTYIKVGQHVGAMEYLLPSQDRIHRFYVSNRQCFQFMFPIHVSKLHISGVHWTHSLETSIQFRNKDSIFETKF